MLFFDDLENAFIELIFLLKTKNRNLEYHDK